MQSNLYIIIYLCYENFAKINGNEFIVGNHIFESDSMDIKFDKEDNDTFLESLQEHRSYKIKRLTRNETKQNQIKSVKEITDYLDYLIRKAQTQLLSNIQYYETYLQKKNYNPVNVADNYKNYLKRYFNKTFNEEDVINEIDKQFVVLDLIETSNKLLLNMEKKIISNMTDNRNVSNTTNAILMSKYYKLVDDINKEIMDDKIEEMKHICEMFDICRMFPSYSDYISDLLCVIINFSDVRIDNVVTQLIILIKENINIFKEILGERLTNAVGDKLYSIFSVDVDAIDLRQVLSIFNKLLAQRHKFSHRKNHPKSTKAKAIRLLIDIVDKTFDKDDDEILLMYIEITKKGLRDWSELKEHDISSIMGNFIRYTAKNLKFNWTADTKKEVRTLVEVLMKRQVNSEDVYEYLLSKGSQYVNTKRNNDLDFDLI